MEGFDGKGGAWELRVEDADPRAAKLRVVGPCALPGAGSFRLTLAQALPKGAKWEEVLRRGCELGVSDFWPLLTQRTVARPDARGWENRRSRAARVLREAARQCGRSDIPSVGEPRTLEEALREAPRFGLILMPHAGEAPPLPEVLRAAGAFSSALVLVGPEGGWDPRERECAALAGALAVHLPTPVLRAETAALAACAMVLYHSAAADFRS